MELNRCPNCSGKLVLSSDRKKMECPYCGSEFALTEEAKKTIENTPVAKDWFIYEWNYNKLISIPKCSECISSFTRALNELGSSAKIEEFMRDYQMNFDGISAPGINEGNMRKITERLNGIMMPGERIILYSDDGIFAHGKTGVAITDKRTCFIEKRNIRHIMHANVPYLLFGYSIGLPEVKLGEQYANNIGIFNSHFDMQGTAAALICALAFEGKPDRPKIRLTDSL